MKGFPLPEVYQPLPAWAGRLVNYLKVLERAVETPAPKAVQLDHAKANASAAQNGVLMWDNVLGKVIVSKDGEWYALDMTPVIMVGLQNKAVR